MTLLSSDSHSVRWSIATLRLTENIGEQLVRDANLVPSPTPPNLSVLEVALSTANQFIESFAGEPATQARRRSTTELHRPRTGASDRIRTCDLRSNRRSNPNLHHRQTGQGLPPLIS